MKHLLAIFGLLWCWSATAAERIPPVPERYFNDYANVVPAATANQLNRTLEQFERDTSSQIVVAVFPKMESDSSIEEYTVRVFRAWKVGQTNKNNGAVLFVFVQDHRLRIATGYGLEGALPDALCKRIIDDEITPQFRAGNYAGGLTAGVTAMIAAAKGEYKGTGRTVNENRFNQPGRSRNVGAPSIFPIIFIIVFVIILIVGRSRGGRGGGWGGWSIGSGGFGSFGGGGFGGFSGGGGGFSDGGGGGGGFSGGGGDTGGGGASGSW